MNNSSKGLCYKNFKDCFEFENYLNLLDDKDRQLLCKFRTCNHRLPIEIGRWQGIERQNRTCNICDKNEIGDEFHYVLQCPSLHDDRRRLLDSTYLTRVNVLKFANLFQSRNKIKLRHLCKFINFFFQKHVLLVSHLSLLLCCVFIVLHPSSCHVHANIDIECLCLSLYHCNALVYENKES